MSSTTPFTAIKTRLIEQFGGTYGVIDWTAIETALQQGTEPFIAVDDSGGAASLESIGTPDQNWSRDTGFVPVHIFSPSNQTLDAARTLADEVRASMRYVRFPAPDGETLRCLNVDPPSPGVVHDGLWHSMLVSIDFEYRYPVATAT